jgi:tetratricopeptide (TPR) repeat protein
MQFARFVLLVSFCVSPWLSIASPSIAEAQDADTALARTEFERGRAAYEAGAFEDALTAFQRAYELTQDAQILFNVATVADRLRRDEIALEAYEGYLAGYPAAPDRANVEARIRAIRAARGTTATETTTVIDADTEIEDTEVVLVEASPPALSVEAPASSNASEGGLVLTVAGGVIALAGAGLFIATAVEIEAASNAETWTDLMGPYDRVPILSAAGVISLVLGGAIAAVGIGWLVTSGSADEPAVALRIGPGSLSIAGSF